MPKIIQENPNILGGQPVIRGTRVPVSRVLALVGLKYSLTKLKKEIPQLNILKKKDIADILLYYRGLNYQ